MSGIPVRKTQVTDSRKFTTKSASITGSQTAVGNGRLEGKRGGRKKSAEEELRDENVKLKSEKTSKQKSICRLERDIEKLQEEISHLKKTSENKENSHRTEVDGLNKKNILYEEQIESYNKKLLLSNINPVTLEPMEPTEEQVKCINERKELAKEKVQRLKKRIDDFNSKSNSFLQDLQNIGEKLDNIGDAKAEEGVK